MVDRPLIYTLEEVNRLPSEPVSISSHVRKLYLDPATRTNPPQTVQRTHGATSCSEWTGVPLTVLLRESGVQKRASWLLCEGAEWKKHTISIPLTKAMDDVMVAYAQNGEALRRENGLSLAVAGARVRRDSQREIPEAYQGGGPALHDQMGNRRLHQSVAERKSALVPVRTRAEFGDYAPLGRTELAGPGFCEITGFAWSGAGSHTQVDVSTDGGRTWKPAELQEPVLPKAHTRFRFPWQWNGEETVIQSRSTDEWGSTTDAGRARPKSGA